MTAREAGLQVFYRLADPAVHQTYRALQRLAQARLAEMQRLVEDYFSGADGLEPVQRAELLRRVSHPAGLGMTIVLILKDPRTARSAPTTASSWP